MRQSNIPYKWFPERLSPTSDFGLFSQCQTRWLNERVFCLRKEATSQPSDNVNLAAGGAFATALQRARQAYYIQKLSAEEAVEVGQRFLLGEFAQQFAASPYAAFEKLKTPTALAQTFHNYFAEVSFEEERVVPFQLPDKSISVELPLFLDTPFRHPLTNKYIQLHSRLDLLGWDGEKVIVVDEKTCRSTLTDHVKQTEMLRTEVQFLTQVSMVNKLAPQLGIPSCISMEVRKVKIGAAKPLVKYPFYIERYAQKMWWDNCLDTISDMIRVFERERGLRDLHLGCTSYFEPCPWTQACTSRVGERLLSNGYVQLFRNSETNSLLPLKQHIQNTLNPTTGA
jgi:hypothetical protein